MIKQIKKWSNKPYFLIDKLNIKLAMVIGVGLFTYLFLYTFQPYGIHKVVKVNPLLITGYGILVSFSLFISYFILPKIFSFYFSPRSWTVQKEAIFLMVSFLIISTLNYFYHNIFVAKHMPEFSYLRFVSVVFSIGIFPVLLIIFMVERYLFKKHNSNTNSIIEEISKNKKEFVAIPSDNLKEASFTVDIDDIFYAQSNNNYTTIIYLNDQVIKQKLIRVTLKTVSGILEQYPQFIRCHRSFLVNKKQISKVMGNARTLEVELNKIKKSIPVSRSFPKDELIY